MLNLKLIYKITGQLLWLEGLLMIVCLFVSLYYQEDDTFSFAVAVVLTILSGLGLHYLGHSCNNNLGRRDAYIVVTTTWIIFSLFGLLPFMIGGYIDDFTDAFFETMSGFTTTGATCIDDVERLPHGILFWRTMTQWIGGLGIVFFTIALLPSLVGGGSVKVFAAETTGPIRTKLHPRLSTNSHSIWLVYIAITIACALCYYLGGMSLFDCLNYAMTTTATGGFATHNASTEFFRSQAIEYTGAFFMFISGINFTMLYLGIFKLRLKELFRNSEVLIYSMLTIGGASILMWYLYNYNHYDLEDSFRYAIFQIVSFLTSTGLFSDDAGKWHHVTWIVLGVSMFIGGCAGSTAGGFKCIRIIMVIKLIRNEFKHILHPNAVFSLRINGSVLHDSQNSRLLAFLSLYLMAFLLSSAVFTASGVDVINSITIALSCLSNVGPTLGVEIGPTMSWDILPVHCKWFCSFLMLLGRLEIFSVLIIFTPDFWRNN